jgi:hypothetical protein
LPTVKALRNQEMAIAEQAERAYQHYVAQWQPKPTMKRRATNTAAWSRHQLPAHGRRNRGGTS